MKIRIVFDFHDIFADSSGAWKKAFYSFCRDKSVFELYDAKVSKKKICDIYGLNYAVIEQKYRTLLKPNQKNVEFLQKIQKIYPVDIVSMSQKDRLQKDICKLNLQNAFSSVFSKENISNRGLFLKKIGQNYDWLIFFNHEFQNLFLDKNVIYCPIDFQGDIKKFEKMSFTEHAKNKLIYNELSDIYLEAIANDTAQETNLIDTVIKLHGKGRTILDCCCGVGRHCKALAEKDYIVTGVDFSEQQISNAKKINSHSNVSYHEMDIRNIRLNQTFDTAICMWTTYNYLSQESDFLAFIQGVYRHLVKGGILILDSKNIPSLDKNRVYKRSNKTAVLELELLVCKRIIKNIQNSQYFYFIKRNGKNEFYMDEEFVRFYHLSELKKIMKKYFKVIKVYGDFNMCGYKVKKSKRFIVVLKKR